MVARRNARPDSNRVGTPSSWNSRRQTGHATAARPIAVHAAGVPGRTVQPRRSTATVTGAIRLRRRLSRIFQRDTSGRRLRCRPVGDGTKGKSHHRICQSPRTQRCWRLACARTLDG